MCIPVQTSLNCRSIYPTVYSAFPLEDQIAILNVTCSNRIPPFLFHKPDSSPILSISIDGSSNLLIAEVKTLGSFLAPLSLLPYISFTRTSFWLLKTVTKSKQVTEVGLKRPPAEQITEDNCNITITYFGVIRSFSELVYVERRPEQVNCDQRWTFLPPPRLPAWSMYHCFSPGRLQSLYLVSCHSCFKSSHGFYAMLC